MKKVNDIVVGIVILCLSVALFFQGQTIKKLQENQKIMNDTFVSINGSIKNLTDIANMHTENFSIIFKMYKRKGDKLND